VRVCIIPARGGSVRIPRKNILDFYGRRMLAYPLHTARASGLFDLIVVSTDDAEIAGYSFTHGAIIVPRLPDDGTIGTQEIAARVLDQLQIGGGAACVLYPCTPLLDVYHLRLGWTKLLSPEARCFTRSVGPDGQDAGCFYWGWTRAFRDRRPLDDFNTLNVELPAERVCDINTPEDMARASAMFDALRRAP
jgi:pseudaminic acid cytidylyltransferase